MRWRRALGGTLKWGCTAGTVLLAVLWVGSRWWEVGWSRSAGGKATSISFNTGGAFFWHWAGLYVQQKDEPAHFFAHRLREDARSGGSWKPGVERMSIQLTVYVPLWIPFAVAAVSAGALWCPAAFRRHPRAQQSCPACGYDRRGLAADAKCPECGVVPTHG
jgi:hypothetical protein